MFWMMIGLICAQRAAQQDGFFCNLFGVCNDQDDKGQSIKRPFSPHTDCAHDEKHYRITIELPGVSVKDIKIETENRNLYISGEKKQAVEEKSQKTFRQECKYGAFKRELELPEDALVEGIKATCKENVLAITIPRKPSDRKTIPIQTV